MKHREFISHLFESCKDVRSIVQLHSHILKSGLLHDSFFATKLSTYYAKYTSVAAARKLFDETPQQTIYLWNSVLRAYSREKQWQETLHLFLCMMSTAITIDQKPDNFTVPIALKACAGLLALKTGQTIHGLVKKIDCVDSDMFVGVALIELYAKCGKMDDALRVFQDYPQPDVVLWTSMVTGYQQNGHAEGALSFFTRMVVSEGATPDPVTLVSVTSACAELMNLKLGRCIHGFSIKRGWGIDLSLVNSLLNLYAKTASVNSARNLFNMMPEKDLISWSSMVACYAQNAKAIEALNLFNEMIEKKLEPNSVTMVSALQACATSFHLKEGRRIHELAIQKGCELDIMVSTALLDMYMKCSCLGDAIKLFKRMPNKDVVSWATLISGYAWNGLANESVRVFRSMLCNNTWPDAVAMVKLLSACSDMGILLQALCLHGYLIRSGFDKKAFVGAALIELYCKCGSLDSAIKVFKGMGERDVVVWSSMIAGYGIHGKGREALQTLDQMIEASLLQPNHVTFLSILSACSHANLVEEGIEIFNKMVQEYKIQPNSEHYSVMVDLLGRSGELDKAMNLINQMPVPASPHVWGALLGACRIHHNVELGETAAKNLFQLDPNHAGYYVLLSNIYADDGNWDNVEVIRTLIKGRRLKGLPGYSSIVVGSKVHTFLAADRSHPESECIYLLLRKLEVEMRGEGFVQLSQKKDCKEGMSMEW
ncbi:PREDICTED: putative pentatricopeptide repeat-containing protein At3g01580 [Nelumbo nucifera]|uniref:Pentatricopeptide repeat-containing protein At3g01580 n=1 Tax=Nelumbo nucifera TaxID=4432 RepID=A0A1U8Q3B8_NELNU|nr:PREDICTED: putative pentatricopeptide repeat-containing protein At3g01580 [Nelumbo nucifera]XP_019052517.1 PREDICTED: putative pentatricopeptide repeat-containing protein At3g01580 [Nelumbo nucifera]XP_019052520.1 PREDICTED: putative pentatricopeptide repeat-containing protein At3g01580 [Nelumbo nucifera]XP_019052522.1 PREDICTED: putative pentatricopeptide repeat-containing protein At3g01580 [Nelumbo nucifera]XP_019052524.1 PREDICTED: putative pentatricopeptide repeat-containing protein At3g